MASGKPLSPVQDPKDTALHGEAFHALEGGERGTPFLAAERRLEERFAGRGWAEGVINATCYDQDGDRHTACPGYILPEPLPRRGEAILGK